MQHKEWKDKNPTNPIGPNTYSPWSEKAGWEKGTRIGLEQRLGDKVMSPLPPKQNDYIKYGNLPKQTPPKYMGAPAPNTYSIKGDFDFRDPTNPDRSAGKLPKFAFGVSLPTKTRNMDMPGPGTYETDTIPMNQKKLAYWIGTDVRKPLGVHNAHLYPGPGEYETVERNPGPYIG